MRALWQTTVFLLIFWVVSFSPAPLSANPGVSHARNPIFSIPPRLEARVGFWIDIFTKYGKNQSVIHHREYPYIVFNKLDFSREAQQLNDLALEKFKKKAVEKAIVDLRAIFRKFAKGEKPSSSYEEHVAVVMEVLGPELEKYKQVLADDLIRSQTGIREKYAEAVRRSGRYLPVMEQIFVREFALPVELTRLPFVESSFDYDAYSSAGAAGIWQFMPRTGRLYMSVNSVVDERRDAIESTRAAARYLQHAYSKIGSWPLALTSYNHGIGGVLSKVKKAGTANIVKLIEGPGERPFGFASANFYPEFLAALEVYENLHHFFPEVTLEPALKIYQHSMPQPVSLNYLVTGLGIDLETLRALNPALSKAVWTGRYSIPTGYSLKVPVEYEAKLAALKIPEPRAQVSAPPASSVYGGNVYKVRSGDTLIRIAKKYGTSVPRIRQLNNLSSDALRPGQLLVVSEKSAGKHPEQPPAVAVKAAKPEPAVSAVIGTKHKVVKGDSLYEIARKYNTTVYKLRELNHLKSTKLQIGQELVVE